MSSSYQMNHIFFNEKNTHDFMQGAALAWGYEINPNNTRAYARYYIFIDYGNALLQPHSTAQINFFTYGVGGDMLLAYNKNPVNSWALFMGLQIGASTWIYNHKAKDIVVNTWNAFSDLVFKPQRAYFRVAFRAGVQWRTIVTWHMVDVEVGIKVFLNPGPKSPIERNFAFFVSHAWHF
ncbi:outer membrane beta-barrel protein [Helicobacter cynogastricus]|uniref:outer membrane beta-barrel protein n=1 Tax=Helicobacter cynogastricus TaxID=329937 RepID=UPI001F351267|nr:outer membrane beta-barrel protein [Helicobacter cynogastricus]